MISKSIQFKNKAVGEKTIGLADAMVEEMGQIQHAKDAWLKGMKG